MSPKADEDDMRIDPRLTRIGLAALAAVSDAKGVDFFDLDLDGKKKFLTDFGGDVISIARASQYGRYFENRVIMLIENDGNAGLVFVKRVKCA